MRSLRRTPLPPRRRSPRSHHRASGSIRTKHRAPHPVLQESRPGAADCGQGITRRDLRQFSGRLRASRFPDFRPDANAQFSARILKNNNYPQFGCAQIIDWAYTSPRAEVCAKETPPMNKAMEVLLTVVALAGLYGAILTSASPPGKSAN